MIRIEELSKDLLRLVSVVENLVNTNYDSIVDDVHLTNTYMNLQQAKRDIETVQYNLDRKVDSYDREE